jgi:hypothetical protein
LGTRIPEGIGDVHEHRKTKINNKSPVNSFVYAPLPVPFPALVVRVVS